MAWNLPFTTLEELFDSVDCGLVVLDANSRVRGWNRWMQDASGIGAADSLGETLEQVFAAPLNSRLSEAIAGATQSGTSSILTHLLHRQVFPLRTYAGRALLHTVIVRAVPGLSSSCLIQINDVTVATERDRVLRERQNARYDAVVDSAPDAIITLDITGIIQMANPATAREFGYEVSDLIGQPITLLLPDQQVWNEAGATLLGDQASIQSLELVGRRSDGSSTHLEVAASQWRAETRVFVTAILRNVNERRAAADALQSLNQTLEMRVAERTAERDRMWRLSSDVMLVARLDGQITATNPAWNTLLQWDAATLKGKRLGELVVPEDHDTLSAALRRLAEVSTPCRFEVRLRNPEGVSRWIAWSAVAADGLLQAVGRDVENERAAEAALKHAEEALQQSQKMDAIGQLTGGIAHDFNNMLTGIIGAMSIIKRRITAQRYSDLDRFIDAAITSAERAAALTHRLLAFARRQPLDARPVDVNRLLVDMNELLRRCVGEQIHLEIACEEDVWPVHTDAHQLENAVLNLAINARDAMPDGGRLTVETTNVALTDAPALGLNGMPAGDYVLISVADTGVGMSAETQAKVFEPFFTTKPTGEGTGLGLSMIYGFVKQSEGFLWIDSRIHHGTRVRLYLPRYHGAPPATAARPVEQAPEGAGETVLLVEDDPAVRLLIAEVLVELGYTCLEAEDSDSGLSILASDAQIDMMISDVGLPGLNGRQLADLGRQYRPDLKVLFVTGYAEHAMSVRGDFLAPGMEIITKPFALEALAIKIRMMIQGSSPGSRKCL